MNETRSSRWRLLISFPSPSTNQPVSVRSVIVPLCLFGSWPGRSFSSFRHLTKSRVSFLASAPGKNRRILDKRSLVFRKIPSQKIAVCSSFTQFIVVLGRVHPLRVVALKKTRGQGSRLGPHFGVLAAGIPRVVWKLREIGAA